MKIACIVYPGCSAYDLACLKAPLERLSALGLAPDLAVELCAPPSTDPANGSTRTVDSLAGYAGLLVPGNLDEWTPDPACLEWLAGARDANLKAAVGSGAGLLDAAGLLTRARTYPVLQSPWQQQAAREVDERVTLTGDVLLAQNSAAALDLGFQLCERIAGKEARARVARDWGFPGYPADAPAPDPADLPAPRQARLVRETRETQVTIELGLDGTGKADIHSGVPFLDHMLTQVAVHGLFDLQVQATGDLEIDPHHTVEDVALTLGKAFDQALGERKGLVRMASATVPMDESLATVVIDLSGRPYAVVAVDWNGPEVGRIPTTLIAHFLESFAVQARCNLHVRLLAGGDDHHRAEAIFKALGRALDAATQIDPRRMGSLPSSKGAL